MSSTPTTPMVPDYLRSYMTEQPKSAEADSMASSSMSVPRVSLRAKKFRFTEGGEERFAEQETHVVILATEPGAGRFVKTYYDGPYNPGDSSPPTCSSSDGIAPDMWVTTPQNAACATCRHNVFGSATSRTGKKSKACRDSKRLWVARADDIMGTVYGLNVPVTSLKNLSELGNTLKGIGAPVSAAVVKLTMDDDESFPIVNFSIAGWLNGEWGPKAIERNQAKDWPGAVKADQAALAAPQRAAQIAHSQAEVAAVASSAPPGEPTTKEGEVMPKEPIKGNDVDNALSTWQ